MPRNIRSNFLTDKSTFGNTTMPIGAIVPIFKADDDKITDNGVVTSLGSVVAGAGGGTGYTTDLGTVAGYPTGPVTLTFAPGNFSVSTEQVNFTNHPFIEGDKVTVVNAEQQPNQTSLGGSIATIAVTNGGSGYTAAPLVQVTDTGSGPVSGGEFTAVIDANGAVTGVTVSDGGTGYQFPQVSFVGGNGNGAAATATLSAGGQGGVAFETGFTFYVDYINANSFRLARSNGDIAAGRYYNVTDLGSAGTFTLASTTGFGLTVGVAANLDGSVNFVTIKNPGYGYSNGDVVYILQPGSSGTARVEIVNTSSTTATDPAMQYPGWLYCDGSQYNADDYPLLYQVLEDNYGGSGTHDVEDFGSTTGTTFNVPDYKARKLVGAGGGVSGSGSPVSGNVISTVGATGGRWFFSKDQQEALFDIGNIIISGYTNVQEFVGGTMEGEVTLVVGPLQEKMISAVPEHEHAILTSQAPEAGAFEGAGFFADNHSVGYKNSTGQVNFFLPSGGTPLFHTHGIVDYVITDPNLSTFGNVAGVGEKETVTITASAILGTGASTTFNVPGHDLFTGNMIRVQSNEQTTLASFTFGSQQIAFAANTIWYVIKVDNDTFSIAKTKYDARVGNALSASTNGSSGQDIILELAYKIAGNLPADTTTVIQTPQPTVFDIDDTYTIGGKTITIPGGEQTTTVYKSQQNSPGTYTVPAPDADELPIEGISGYLGGGGGGGATTEDNGNNGQSTYYQFSYSGTTFRLHADGGTGGTKGESGGSAGSGGAARLQVIGGSTTNINATGTYNSNGITLDVQLYYPGNNGTNGSPSAGGTGGASSYIGGAGGDGSRTLFTGTNLVEETFSSPSSSFYSYNVPSTWPLDQLQAEIWGGGGGSGGTGDGGGGWHAGNGGSGKKVIANINQGNSGTLRIYVGGGGNAGNGRNAGSGGVGFASGGNGGNGTGGGGGGGGGGASSVGTPSAVIAGAGGGGGGGAAGDGSQAGDQNGQPNNSSDAVQNLSGIFSGSGNNGGNSVCSGGGGGGGGGGTGIGSGIGGGGGGGNGSNSRRDGFGGKRGQSAVKNSGSGPTATVASQGNAGNGGTVSVGQQNSGGSGKVIMKATENQTFYGSGGGGGGSAAYIFFNITGPSNVNAGTMRVGNGGTNGGGNGQGGVGYTVTEQLPGGTGTSVTSGLFDSSSATVNYIESGTGSGSNGGFQSTNTEKYLRFFGNEAVRWARTVTINASSSNSKGSPIIAAKFRVIRGNGSNGGETPGEPLVLFASNDSGGSYTQIGTISSASGPTNWTMVQIPISTTFQVNNLLLEVRQTRGSTGNANGDNFGIDYVEFIHDEVEQTITTYPSGKADLGIEFITERIEPQGNPLTSAGLDVNEGTFTLSSAVKLNVTSTLSPEIDIPLLTRYHLVKYMIRAY